MTEPDSEQRYQEIMRRIAQGKSSPATETAMSTCVKALDALNIVDLLDDLRRHPPDSIQCYGPKSIVRKTWAGTVVWCKRKGFNTHLQLLLLGVWAIQRDDAIAIVVGTKELVYSAPIYTAEAYHKLIRTDYTVYYDDDGSPPPEKHLFSTVYDPAERLAIRQAIADAAAQWLTGR